MMSEKPAASENLPTAAAPSAALAVESSPLPDSPAAETHAAGALRVPFVKGSRAIRFIPAMLSTWS